GREGEGEGRCRGGGERKWKGEGRRTRGSVLAYNVGTGKTTFMHRLVCHMQASANMRGYVLNLDPAVMTLPFGANIDIRDTVRYKEVMKEYGLGPNGG
uniref:GPN-loop GTPase n=1 Tax=Aegilops tauschii subsp. strangulata TaxID=200361 RepID=A0A453I7X2_AEGTS